jgi:hypothetical protein
MNGKAIKFKVYQIQPKLLLVLLLALSGCNLAPISESEALRQTQIRESELDVNVKQTLLAQLQENREVEQTSLAGTEAIRTLTPELVFTLVPTEPPFQATEPAVQESEPPALTELPPPVEFDEAAYQEWKNSAKILLYEDMTARLDTVRYVKLTLDKMGLDYKDDGSAYGWLLDDLDGGPPDGGQWDLIILAAEDKAGIKADFFSPSLSAVDQGTPVILETWYLDGAHTGSASGLLSRCGVSFENNWERIPPSGAAMFSLSPENPIMQQPNGGLNLSSTTNFWWDPDGIISYDVGDLMKLSMDTNATLLIGTMAGDRFTHGTSMVCLGGMLILQTFSSHLLTFNSMSPLWENYVDNALRARFIQIQ